MEHQQIRSALQKRSLNELLDDRNFLNEEIKRRKAETIEQEKIFAVRAAEATYRKKMECLRVEGIMEQIIQKPARMPVGMNGYNVQSKRFVRWLPDYDRPVAKEVSEENEIPADWFVDKTLQVYLHWNCDGYYEMSSKDSLKFIKKNDLCIVYNLLEDSKESSSDELQLGGGIAEIHELPREDRWSVFYDRQVAQKSCQPSDCSLAVAASKQPPDLFTAGGVSSVLPLVDCPAALTKIMNLRNR